MTKIRKNIYALETYFKDLEYQVIKFKYFIIVIIALLLEVITVAIFLLNSEKIIEVQLFNASLLFTRYYVKSLYSLKLITQIKPISN